MALRGIGAGGYSFTLPDGYNALADLSAFLWVRRGNNVEGGSRIFNLVNGARTRGFTIHVGGSSSGTSLPTEVVISVSSANENTWGAGANQAGRGRATLPVFTESEFHPLAFSIRGSAAADNTGSGGAQQLHEVWWRGAPATVETGAVGSGVPKPGGRMTLLCREASNLSAFDGWVAEVAVWQGYRLSEVDAARLARGASPLSIAPEQLLIYHSCRTSAEAEVGSRAMSTLGAGGAVDTAVHPPLLIESDGGRHGAGSSAPALAVQARAALHSAAGRHFSTAGPVGLAATGRLALHGGRHAQAAGAPLLLPLAGAAETWRVPPEERWTTAGWP